MFAQGPISDVFFLRRRGRLVSWNTYLQGCLVTRRSWRLGTRSGPQWGSWQALGWKILIYFMRLRYTLFFTSIYDEWRSSLCGASYLCEPVADLFRLCFMGLAMGIVDSSHGGGKAKSLIHERFTAHCSIRAIESFHLGLTRNAIKATSNHTVTYGVKNQKVSNYITKSIPFNPPNHCCENTLSFLSNCLKHWPPPAL